MNYGFDFYYHPDCAHVLPTFSIIAVRCGNPACNAVHGYGVDVRWLFWDLYFGPVED